LGENRGEIDRSITDAHQPADQKEYGNMECSMFHRLFSFASAMEPLSGKIIAPNQNRIAQHNYLNPYFTNDSVTFLKIDLH
jgi:hypothetical protein